MLSIELIRKDPDYVKKALESRGEENPLGGLLELDARRHRGIPQMRTLRPGEETEETEEMEGSEE